VTATTPASFPLAGVAVPVASTTAAGTRAPTPAVGADDRGGGSGAVPREGAAAPSPVVVHVLTIPTTRLGHVSQRDGELFVDLHVTADQLARAGIGTGAGVTRPGRWSDAGPADNQEDQP
jgi:hypothetical protein